MNQKIKNLLEQRENTRARLKKIQEFWKEEKDNEEAWPGQDTKPILISLQKPNWESF